MSFKRRNSLKDNERNIRKLRGPNGFRLCRWCGEEVRPPRRTFCSDAHVHEWKLRSSVKYLREKVYERDLGKCASCGVDTRLQRTSLEDALRPSGDARSPAYVALLKSLDLTASEAKRSLWQADHVKPVAEGGGLCGLEGIQTLCVKCHKRKSRGQASYAAPKAGTRPPKGKGLPGIIGVRGPKGFKGKF